MKAAAKTQREQKFAMTQEVVNEAKTCSETYEAHVVDTFLLSTCIKGTSLVRPGSCNDTWNDAIGTLEKNASHENNVDNPQHSGRKADNPKSD